MRRLRESIAEELPFQTWWAQIARMKCASQWRAKIAALGAPRTAADYLSPASVGEALYIHLNQEGEYSLDALQAPPPAA